MILVAGLAVAGLVGIAAAFYFSIRSGHGGDKRLRSAAAGRAGTDRRPGSRSAGPARPGPADNARRMSNAGRSLNAGRAPNAASRNYQAEASTGPNPVPDFGDRPRRRVGFRKGADLDEELWPAESFGGISDEQFWDDLASDKPLTTTARTAQQEPGPRKRPLDAAPVPVRAKPEERQPVRAKPEERSRGGDRRGAGYGAYPESRTGPNPAAERTAVQPAYTATQPVRVQATQPPAAARTQPAETRGHRRRSSAEEDPLTSSAFALRASGPVDGRSALRSRDSSGGGSGEFRVSEPRPGGGTSPHPYPGGSYGDTSAVTQAVNTPPHGENYGYGSGSPADRAGDPRRQNGTRNQARPAAAGEGTRPARVYPQDGHQATGIYQGNGNYPTGGYPPGGYRGNGHQGNGHRAPYDPRDDYRRLTHQR